MGIFIPKQDTIALLPVIAGEAALPSGYQALSFVWQEEVKLLNEMLGTGGAQ